MTVNKKTRSTTIISCDTVTSEMVTGVNSIITPVCLVGGSVRDVIPGTTPKDYDFCTPLLPDDIEEKVRAAGRRPYLIGKKFGTVGFKLNGKFIEVTTYRQERYEKNNRKPQVDFVNDLESDLARRDFTINAIAMGVTGEENYLMDPFAGRKDIDNKIIRSVGKDMDRINEDPLRMLRAARFASQLDFDVSVELIATISRNEILYQDDSIKDKYKRLSDGELFGFSEEEFSNNDEFVFINLSASSIALRIKAIMDHLGMQDESVMVELEGDFIEESLTASE